MENEPENFPKYRFYFFLIGLRNRSFLGQKTYLAKFFLNSPGSLS